jgi:hypothetical protein
MAVDRHRSKLGTCAARCPGCPFTPKCHRRQKVGGTDWQKVGGTDWPSIGNWPSKTKGGWHRLATIEDKRWVAPIGNRTDWQPIVLLGVRAAHLPQSAIEDKRWVAPIGNRSKTKGGWHRLAIGDRHRLATDWQLAIEDKRWVAPFGSAPIGSKCHRRQKVGGTVWLSTDWLKVPSKTKGGWHRLAAPFGCTHRLAAPIG